MADTALDLLTRGEAAHQAGRLSEAESLYREVLQQDPECMRAKLLLGIALGSIGKLDQGVQMLRDLVSANPNSPPALNALSILLRNAGQVEEATSLCFRALSLDPNDFDLHNNLGMCCLSAGKPLEAAQAFARAIELLPTMGHLHNNLGVALQLLGRTNEAGTAFRKAIEEEPADPAIRVRLGRLLIDQSRRSEAIACLRSALELDPSSARAHVFLAEALYEDGDYPTAEQLLRRGIELDPTASEPQALLGYRLKDMGRFQEAIACYEKSLELNPNQGGPYMGIVYSRKITEADQPLIDRMTALAATGRLGAEDRGYLHYALGKSFEDLARFEDAMLCFDEANRLVRERLNLRFDPKEHEGYVERITAAFPKDFVQRHAQLGCDSELPLLIVGMMRSGTTLVEQILSSHPHVAAGAEIEFWSLRVGAVIRHVFGGLGKVDDVSDVARDYRSRLRALGPKMRRVTDKMPSNYLHLGVIHLLFPRARIVHCRRHPIDNCLSVYLTPNREAPDFAHDKENIAAAYEQYLRMIDHWRSVLPEDRFFDIDYETLVSSPEETVRSLLAFCGLEWNEACLHPEANDRIVRTPSQWQVRQPINRQAVDRWKNYEPWLGPLRRLAP